MTGLMENNKRHRVYVFGDLSNISIAGVRTRKQQKARRLHLDYAFTSQITSGLH
jgi:hypothetical protein